MRTVTLYFYRHGMTKGNLNAQYIGQTDLPITIDGIEKLKKTKAKYHYPKVDVVFVSPLKRAKESANIMFPGCNQIVIDDFNEYNFGEFEGKCAEELTGRDDFKAWLTGDKNARPPHGESNIEFSYRICNMFEKVINGILKTPEIKSAAFVCPAGVLMSLLQFYGVPEANMTDWMMDFGYGYKLILDPTMWMQANKIEVSDTSPQTVADSMAEAEGNDVY